MEKILKCVRSFPKSHHSKTKLQEYDGRNSQIILNYKNWLCLSVRCYKPKSLDQMLSSNIRNPGDENDINFSDGVGGSWRVIYACSRFVNIWNMTDTPRIKIIRIQDMNDDYSNNFP